MKDYDKNKEFSFLKYWDINRLYGWGMLQKFPVNGFGQADDEGFIKSRNKESKKGYFVEVDIQYLEN